MTEGKKDLATIHLVESYKEYNTKEWYQLIDVFPKSSGTSDENEKCGCSIFWFFINVWNYENNFLWFIYIHEFLKIVPH